ncbi:MAG: PqqD family protein [Bryobacteraceae bacterium]|jgi:hypothetical protein
MSEFRAAEQVRWAVEAAGVVLIDGATGAATTLGYPEAAIWDLITRGDSRERIAAKLCAIAGLEPAAAQELVLNTVAVLREAGFLAPRGSGG